MSEPKKFGVNNYEQYWIDRKKRNRTGKTEIHNVLINIIEKYIKTGGTILDIGVGPGHVFKELQKKYNCYGIEFAEEAYKLYDFPTEQIVRHDVQNGLPEFNNRKYFDAIIASHIIHHMDNPNFFIKECARLMNDQSILIIATPNTVFLPLRLRYLFKGEFPNLSHGHKNFLTPYQYKKILSENNLKIENIYTTGRHTLLNKILPFQFSGTLFFVCKKY